MGKTVSKHFFRRTRRRILTTGRRVIHADGLESNFWQDLYHNSMTASWPVFFSGIAVIFFVLNTVFATLYYLGDHAIANADPSSIRDYLFFSIETLATVGYGDMHPQTTYGHSIATIEIFLGMSCIAVMTGLIFARFSRPQARIIFAKNAIIGPHNGKSCLMFRVGNARANYLTDARAKLWLVINEKSAEGNEFRRFYRLPILRDENPIFSLTWLLVHEIDQNSPLKYMDAETMKKGDVIFVITLSGFDSNASQDVHVRHVYTQEELRWNYMFVDIVDTSESPKLYVNYNKFHDVKQVKAASQNTPIE